jgi:hypothetical protein
MPPLGRAGRSRRGGPITLRLRRGAGGKRWCAYEQSRNVLSFHGHNARDSTFDQGFGLRTGGGGSGSLSGCNDLAMGSREAGAGGGEVGRGFARNPPRGVGWNSCWRRQLPLPPAQPLGACPISRDACCHPSSRTRYARRDARNHANPRAPAFTSARGSGIGAPSLSVCVRSETLQEKRRTVSSQTSMSRTPASVANVQNLCVKSNNS